MKTRITTAVVSALIMGLAAASFAGPTLTPGSPAPTIKVANWVKGTPIDSFEKGKVYVVEFWATWCGPCKTSIPHLTELAKKYADKVTFTGVSVYEKSQPKGDFPTYLDKVKSFVTDYGDKMAYNVAYDGEDGAMAKTWMEAAGQGGIPTAFVIDQNSTIAWIGHPMVGLDKVLDQVIAGTFDSKAEAEKQSKAIAAREKITAAMNPVFALLKDKKYPEAVDALDKAFTADTNLEKGYAVLKFQTLTKFDMAKANTYATELSNGIYKDVPSALNALAWSMVDDQHPLAGADVKVATAIAEKAAAAVQSGDQTEAFILDTLATCYFKDNQLDKAISTEERAIKTADATKDFDPATRKEIADRLQSFKQKKAG